MHPMTELDVLKGIQASIAGLGLDEPMAVEHALALGASFERSAGRILENLPNPGQMALRAIAALPESDVSGPEEEEVFTAYEAEARRVAEVREASRIDAAHPAVLNMSDFAASVCGMKKVV